MRSGATALFLLLSLFGCQPFDPASDVEGVRSELVRRLGAELPAAASGLDAGPGPEVEQLLAERLTEDNAVRIALLNNRDVRATYERLGIARAELVQAGLLRNPVFDADARFLFDGGTELELGLAQPFLDLFYRPLRERLAEHEFAAARLVATRDLVHLVFEVRRNFVHLRAALQVEALQRQALRAAVAAHELTAELFAAGNTTSQALALERLGETQARLDLASAEQAAHEAREPLQVLLGLWGAHTAWSVEGALSNDPAAGVDTEHIEARAITASLDLATHRAGIDAIAQQVGLESWRAWLPDGALGITAMREPGGDWGLGPHLALELPVFDRGSGRKARAGAQLRAELHHHVQLAVEVRSAARLLRDRLQLLAGRVRFQRDVHLPQRAEVVRTTLQTYNAMQIGVFDVLRQKQLQLADGRDHVATLRDAHLARLDLQELLAGGMPAAAMQPMTATARKPDAQEGKGH